MGRDQKSAPSSKLQDEREEQQVLHQAGTATSTIWPSAAGHRLMPTVHPLRANASCLLPITPRSHDSSLHISSWKATSLFLSLFLLPLRDCRQGPLSFPSRDAVLAAQEAHETVALACPSSTLLRCLEGARYITLTALRPAPETSRTSCRLLPSCFGMHILVSS